MKRLKRLQLGMVLFCILATLAVPYQVRAESASVTFGSNYYRATDNEKFKIGVYIKCDSQASQFDNYHIEIAYDTSRLSYIDGGDGEADGVIILEGNGQHNQIKYMLSFQTISGGEAEVAVRDASIRRQNDDGEEESFDIGTMGTAPVYIEGEDIAAEQEAAGEGGEGEDPGEQGDLPFSTDIPIAGQTVLEDETFYIVDMSSYIPKQADWVYKKMDGIYEEQKVTWLTSPDESVRFLYLIDPDEKFYLYAYSESVEQLYPCNTVIMNGTKYYFMSPSVCEVWPAELTLDIVRSEFIVYAMDLSGECGFYKLSQGNELLEWDPDEGKNSLHKQTVKLMIILAVTLVIIAAAVVYVIYFDKQKSRKETPDRSRKRLEEDFEHGEIGESSDEDDDIEFLEDIKLDVSEEEILKWRAEAEENARMGLPVIQVDGVTMRFRIAMQNVSGIKEYFIQLLKKQISYRELLALDNVSFRVYRGEVVGIIGTNGSGKSTLLKIVSGALSPTSGKVIVDRSKVQLLTLGTGFDTELTARENVYLNGAIIGYTKEFIDSHYDEIVEFAELEGFMEEKVKNFSSGMVSRLGFAIATVGDAAEILILDEVLSVGDEFFKKKSLARVKEMIHGGSTVLIVSHSTATIVENCTKAVWIEKGVLKMVGEPKEVCRAYQKLNG